MISHSITHSPNHSIISSNIQVFHTLVHSYINTSLRHDIRSSLHQYVSTFIRQYIMMCQQSPCNQDVNRQLIEAMCVSQTSPTESIVHSLPIPQLSFAKSSSSSPQRVGFCLYWCGAVCKWLFYHDYSYPFCMESTIIRCRQAVKFYQSERNPSGFDEVCFQQREIDLAAENPRRILGWSYSKVVIPIADFHAPFFPFCFHGDWRRKEKADKPQRTYRLRVG